MPDQPPASFRRHRFLEATIDLLDHLTEVQLDCGHEAEIGEATRPGEAWSEQSAQLFECDDVEACAERVRSQQH